MQQHAGPDSAPSSCVGCGGVTGRGGSDGCGGGEAGHLAQSTSQTRSCGHRCTRRLLGTGMWHQAMQHGPNNDQHVITAAVLLLSRFFERQFAPKQAPAMQDISLACRSQFLRLRSRSAAQPSGGRTKVSVRGQGRGPYAPVGRHRRDTAAGRCSSTGADGAACRSEAPMALEPLSPGGWLACAMGRLLCADVPQMAVMRAAATGAAACLMGCGWGKPHERACGKACERAGARGGVRACGWWLPAGAHAATPDAVVRCPADIRSLLVATESGNRMQKI